MYQTPEYHGDEVYSIDCTGDVVVGDHVCFERARFVGSYRKPRFAGFELVTGEVIRDSYGSKKQQHTFTLRLDDGGEIRIKGRNLYKNGTWRTPWADEGARILAQAEKHSRGDTAREEREARKENDIAYSGSI